MPKSMKPRKFGPRTTADVLAWYRRLIHDLKQQMDLSSVAPGTRKLVQQAIDKAEAAVASAEDGLRSVQRPDGTDPVARSRHKEAR